MSPITFTYNTPVSVLAVISATGPTTGGTTVTLIGTAFAYGASVTFGGVSATDVTVVSDNFITCTIPAHAAAAVDVTVTNTDATTGTLVSGFTYQAFPPSVTSIMLNYGAAAGGEAVIIKGSGFVATPTVLFGAAAATSVALIDSNHISCVTPAHAQAVVDITVTNPDLQVGALFQAFTYTTASPFTDTKGWWWSNEGLAGGTQLALSPANPQHPRHWDKLSAFASAGSGMLGGSPAASVVFNNHIIYAGDDYTQGTTQPSIRIFDGTSDRLMARIPNTSAGAISKAIVSMLLINGTIYLTTFDSGTTSANFAGRVFSFNPLSGALTQLGADFTGGEVPYALAWHMDRLWMGTNKSDGTAANVYFIRPTIDTAWTKDYTLTTSTVGGACSMASFNGKLYVGTDNGAGVFAKVLVRDTAGVYTTADTGTGGVATVNNGFLSMIVFNSNLYVTYWNPDTPNIAKIRKFDGTSWTTAFTGSGANIRPYMLSFLANQYLYVVGGGDSKTAALLRTSDGASWTDLTVYLSGPTNETALPIYGVIHA